MTGEELMARLARMTPEERALDVVIGRDGDWYYNVAYLQIDSCEDGHLLGDERPPNVIAIKAST